MPTDDEIRDAFHAAFAPAVGGVTADPAMLSAVRRRHARQQRLLSVGAPLGVAAVTAGAVVGGLAIHVGSGAGVVLTGARGSGPGSEPTQTVQPMQTVSLVGHALSLPSDWRLSGNRALIDLATAEPAQPVGGRDQSVTATSPDGTQRFEATVYAGPIADAERGADSAANDPTFSHLSIDGREAAIKVSGPPTRCLTMDSTSHAAARGAVTGPCPTSDAAHAPYGEARYSFGDGDFMLVDTRGMDQAGLERFLTAALT